MGIVEIERLLKQTIGLDAASVGLPLIERAVQQRIAACDLKNMAAYWQRVSTSQEELQELIEAVVVSETWFFRDQEAFNALGHFVMHEWLPTRSEKKLRLLSIPCATGEEAYSMAMTLEEIGLSPDSFQIDAVDISELALARARKAVYGRNSFRGKNLEFRDRYFEAGPHGHHLADRIRKRVVFQHANLLGPDFFPGAHFFDYIFCRNLLIYLDTSAQDRAIRTLKRLLVPEGLLFVGPAESALLLNHDLVSAKRPLAFAFRQSAPASQGQPVERKITPFFKRKAPELTAQVPKPKSRVRTQRVAMTRTRAVSIEKTKVDLKLATQLADDGRLEEAVKVCEDYLKEHAASVEALYLLGVICDAMGQRDKATAQYRKVLYLQPEHYESLMHLSYAAEKNGDSASAQHLRARAQRVRERRQHAA